jgi:hypothetical protein
MLPYTIHRSARDKWTARSVHYGGHEYRLVRFSNGAHATSAVHADKPASASRFHATLISWRRG